jgi:hypothetical protein
MRALRRRLFFAALVLSLLILAGAGLVVGALTPKGEPT